MDKSYSWPYLKYTKHCFTFKYIEELTEACDAVNLVPDAPAGTLTTFSGCDVTVTLHPDAGDLGNTYSMMTYWQQVK